MKKYLCLMLIALIALASFVSCKAEPEHVHSMKKIEAKPASCTENGYEAYEECECGYHTEITVIPAGHSLEDIEAKPATCTEAGYTAHKACENCDYTEGKEVVPASHEYDAVCTEGHTICSGCRGIDPEETIDNYEAKQSGWSFVDGKTVLTASCGCATENFTVKMGSVGPAGGLIVYDVDADNDAATNDGLSSAELGWRFIEAAPSPLGKAGDEYTLDSSATGYTKESLQFGRRMESISAGADPVSVFLSGTSTVSDITKTGIGEGKNNTLNIADLFSKVTVYSSTIVADFSKTTTEYAVKYVIDLEYNGFDDWFIPSQDELRAVAEFADEVGMSSTIWSSSEGRFTGTMIAWGKTYENNLAPVNGGYACGVLPIRYF